METARMDANAGQGWVHIRLRGTGTGGRVCDRPAEHRTMNIDKNTPTANMCMDDFIECICGYLMVCSEKRGRPERCPKCGQALDWNPRERKKTARTDDLFSKQ